MNNQQEYQLKLTIADRTFTLLGLIVRFAGFVAIAYFLMKSIQALAGQQTNASFVVQLLGSIQADRWAAYIVGVMGAAFGLNERRLRRNSIDRLTKHSAELENRLDGKRTSSKLTTRGTTPKEDKEGRK